MSKFSIKFANILAGVMPAKAGIQRVFKILDASFRWHDIRKITLSLSLILLTGCSLQPVQNTPAKTYVLNPTIPTVTATRSTNLTLLVETPKASQAFDTTQMAYVDKPYQLSYFSYNQWADSGAQMLHPLLVQTLQNTKHFHAVIANANSTQYDIVLSTRLLQLQQIFLQHPSQVQLSMRAQLINNKTHQVIATQQFNITEPTTTDTPYGGVIAANKATEKLLQQIAEFCLSHIN